MSNIRNSNTIYLDSVGAVTNSKVVVGTIVVTSTGSAGSVEIGDSSDVSQKKFQIRVASGETVNIVLNPPAFFPTGVEVTTISNCVVTLLCQNKES